MRCSSVTALRSLLDQMPIVSPFALKPLQWVGNLTLTEGWRGQFVWAGGAGWWQGHTWSLGYEEQFYVVTGVLLLLAGKHWLKGAAAVSLLVVLAVAPSVPPAWTAGFFFDGSWLLFACGLLLYYHRNYAQSGLKIVAPALAIIGVLWAVHRGDAHIAVAAMFALVLVLLDPWDVRIAAHPITRPLSWCGVRCYSIYLVHWPITKAVTGAALVFGQMTSLKTIAVVVPISVAASIGAAAVFHRFVERRFLNPSVERPEQVITETVSPRAVAVS